MVWTTETGMAMTKQWENWVKNRKLAWLGVGLLVILALADFIGILWMDESYFQFATAEIRCTTRILLIPVWSSTRATAFSPYLPERRPAKREVTVRITPHRLFGHMCVLVKYRWIPIQIQEVDRYWQWRRPAATERQRVVANLLKIWQSADFDRDSYAYVERYCSGR